MPLNRPKPSLSLYLSSILSTLESIDAKLTHPRSRISRRTEAQLDNVLLYKPRLDDIEALITSSIRKYGPDTLRNVISTLSNQWRLNNEATRKAFDRLIFHTPLVKMPIVLSSKEDANTVTLYIALKGMDEDTAYHLIHSKIDPETYPPVTLDENGFPTE